MRPALSALPLLLATSVLAADDDRTVSVKENPGIIVPPSATQPGKTPPRATAPAAGHTTVIVGGGAGQGTRVVEFNSSAAQSGLQIGTEAPSDAEMARGTAADNLEDGRVDGNNEERDRVNQSVDTTIRVKDVIVSTRDKASTACITIGKVQDKPNCKEKRP